ncbi:CRP/FNR family transcriptional regulator [Clostridiales Family XIII bacterium PM5-7]
MISETTLKQFLPFWDKLTVDQQEALLAQTTMQRYEANSPVHRGNNDCIGILLVASGRLRTFMLSEDGREITLFPMAEGDICVLSASCILNAITFDVYIDAETDATIYQINSGFFQRLAEENIYAENFMYKVAMGRFSEVMWVMEQVLFMSMDKRMANFLLEEMDETCQINMTHAQIAKHIGTAREVISRMLKYFSDQGYIRQSRGTIEILDIKKLTEIIK